MIIVAKLVVECFLVAIAAPMIGFAWLLIGHGHSIKLPGGRYIKSLPDRGDGFLRIAWGRIRPDPNVITVKAYVVENARKAR